MWNNKNIIYLAVNKLNIKNNKIINIAITGIISGFLNGLFGSGGGVVAVMFLRKLIGDEKKAHASATLMILVMSIVSLIFYACYGHVEWKSGLLFVPGGLVGAVIGTIILKKIKAEKLRRLFGAVIAVSGLVMLLS
ncbi:MAG: sulfite transporter TauE/SafE [Clostridiales bacterium]|nr:MAG: sulfite transporter TauE/SafE [Clostridiales bacterium]